MRTYAQAVTVGGRIDPGAVVDDLDTATSALDAPFAALHLPSLRANVADLRRRAGGTPLRLASKSIRCRRVLDLASAEGSDSVPGDPGPVRGVMAYSLREALWLVSHGATDVLLGYPTVDRGALAELATRAGARAAITLMVDHVDQLGIALAAGCRGVSVCLDVDASLRIGPVHLGVRRSPVRTPDQVAELARQATDRGFAVVGLMFYEAQVAGLQDTSRAIALVKKASLARLVDLRPAAIEALRSVTGRDPEIVNSGGTGSVAESASAPGVTEIAAGSGLYVPALFDRYRTFAPRPALFFALPAVRTPARGMTTFLHGGYVASGVPGPDRLPVPVRPPGMRMLRTEGAGEVQTPVHGDVPIGGRSWWRHAKAGELCERLDVLHLVDLVDGAPAIVETAPTYRGEGKCFG